MGIIYEYSASDLYARYDIDEKPDAKNFSMHIHDRYEIYCFVSGEVKYLVEGYEYTLEPGTLMIMRPGESHAAKILAEKRYERYSVNFYESLLDDIDPEHRLTAAFADRPLGCGNRYSISELRDVESLDIFKKMCRKGVDTYEERRKINVYLLFLLEKISEAYQRRDNAEYVQPDNVSQRIVAYVNRHLFDELSVPFLAGKFFLSTSQLGRIFKQATGSCVWEYVIAKRLTAAREKMRSGFSAKEASDMCGFGDYSAFYRAYVKHFGCAPTDKV